MYYAELSISQLLNGATQRREHICQFLLKLLGRDFGTPSSVIDKAHCLNMSLCQSVFHPINSYLQLLDTCIGSKSLKKGKLVHQFLLKLKGGDFGTQSSVVDKLIHLYISCKKPKLAQRVFSLIPSQLRKMKSILLNQIIRAYAWDGPYQNAVDLYSQMVIDGMSPTKYTYPFVLKACSALQNIEAGLMIHGHVIKLNFDDDVFVCTALVDFYVKCDCLVEATLLFNGMTHRDVVTWNTMISGFSQHEMCWDAIGLALEMQQSGVEVNSSSIVSVLPSIGMASRLMEGKTIHGFCLRRSFHFDEVVATALLDMYGKCGQLVYARKIFDALPYKNEVTRSAMIGACVTGNSLVEGLKLFGKMKIQVDGNPSPVMLATLIRGCAKLNYLNIGIQLHCYTMKHGIDAELMVTNTILSMYAKCGSLDDAMGLLDQMPVTDSVSFSAIMSGFVQNGYAEEALQMFHKMQHAGFEPVLATMMGFLPACSYLAAPQHGICGHAYCVIRGFTVDISISNALIDMYSKCGMTDSAWLVFSKMSNKDVVSWNAMIVGYGINGLGKEAVLLFQNMQDSGCKSDEVTFVALLSACSHSGLVAEGKHLFLSMSQEFNIVPMRDHYFCFVDLLGRAGLLDEAHQCLSSLPFEPDAFMWNALLAACRIHRNVELGEEVSRKIRSLGPASTVNFVLLFNLYSTAQRWKDAANVRIQQKELGFKKKPGCSWIEVNGIVHAFVGGDWSHHHSSRIYKKLEELAAEMKRLGYTAESDFVYQDVEEEEKEKILLHHSEKLAVAFGILSLKENKPILVTKNLRVCGDCHTALKYITIITKRDISVRDTSRFHHFRNGSCSCGDFW